MTTTIISEENYDFFQGILPSSQKSLTSVAFGLIFDHIACGCAEFELNGDNACLEHIYIGEHYRFLGCGRFLIEESFTRLKRYGITSLTCFPTYRPFSSQSFWQIFMKKCYFQEEPFHSTLFHFTLGEFTQSIDVFSNIPKIISMVPLSKLSLEQEDLLFSTLPQEEEQTPSLYLRKHPDFARDLSFVCVEDKKLTGYLLIHKVEDHLLEITGLYYNGKHQTAHQQLFYNVAKNALPLYPPETQIRVAIHNEKLTRVITYMMRNVSYRCESIHKFYRKTKRLQE